MTTLIDFILHSDQHLLEFVSAYGSWVYALLFVIVFAETGVVITPFLPGDSLLFATGALAAAGALNAPTAAALLIAFDRVAARLVGDPGFAAAWRLAVANLALDELVGEPEDDQ